MRARLLAVLLFLAAPLFALDVPPPPTQWFTDTANVVDAATADALNQKLRSFEQTSGAQFIIYIFPTVGGESIEDFTIRCAERWKAGNKKYDNGLILFIFVAERKARIEVGYGLEPTITDAFSSDVIRNDLAPHLRNDDWAGGLNAAADHLMSRIATKEKPVPPSSQPLQPNRIDIIALVVLFLIFLFVVLPILRSGGCGGCSGCALPFFFWPGGGGGFTMGGGGGGWGGGGGFSGGGGSFGGGGATGGW